MKKRPTEEIQRLVLKAVARVASGESVNDACIAEKINNSQFYKYRPTPTTTRKNAKTPAFKEVVAVRGGKAAILISDDVDLIASILGRFGL